MLLLNQVIVCSYTTLKTSVVHCGSKRRVRGEGVNVVGVAVVINALCFDRRRIIYIHDSHPYEVGNQSKQNSIIVNREYE